MVPFSGGKWHIYEGCLGTALNTLAITITRANFSKEVPGHRSSAKGIKKLDISFLKVM